MQVQRRYSAGIAQVQCRYISCSDEDRTKLSLISIYAHYAEEAKMASHGFINNYNLVETRILADMLYLAYSYKCPI